MTIAFRQHRLPRTFADLSDNALSFSPYLCFRTPGLSVTISKIGLRFLSADFSELQTHSQREYACRSISVNVSGRYAVIPLIKLSVLQIFLFVPRLFSAERVARFNSLQPL